jgi:hypothetical protein
MPTTPAPLGLGGSHRRQLPRGCKAGPQTRRRRMHAVAAWLWAAFFAVFTAAASATGEYGAFAVLAPFIAFPYFARPLRGGVLRPRAPRQARGLTIALDPVRPRRGDEIRVTVTSRRSLAGLQIGLLATCWVDRPGRTTIVVPHRLHEQWTYGLSLYVPLDEACSYEGRRFTTAWTVVARLPSGRVKSIPVWIAP